MATINGRADDVRIMPLSDRDLALGIAKAGNFEIQETEVIHFADGETFIKINDSVRAKDIYIVQSFEKSVNDRLMEVLIAMDALKRASARTINVVIPYYPYARQERKSKSREPITARLVADLLETAGADRVITMDLHASQIQGFFNIPIDNFKGLPLVKNRLEELVGNEDLVIVSPDHGGAKRARDLGVLLDAPVAIIDKRRPKPNVSEVTGIIGDVNGKVAILVDDMIDTGGTITSAADAVIEKGASKVYIVATHGLLSGPAVDRIDACKVEKVILTNTLNPGNKKHSDKIEYIDVAPLLSKAITSIAQGVSVSSLFTNIED